MDKTTTTMFRIACGMVITVCGMVISVPVIKGVLWARGELLYNHCYANGDRRNASSSVQTAIECSRHRYDPSIF